MAMQTTLSGMTSEFRRGNRRIAQTLEMTFSYLTQSDMLLIKDHYIDRQGTYDIFFLSAEVWSDFSTPPVPLLCDFAWRYAAAPTITDVSYDRFTVGIKLQTEPIDLSDLIIDGGLAGAAPTRDYTVDGGFASATPARTYVISPGGAA